MLSLSDFGAMRPGAERNRRLGIVLSFALVSYTTLAAIPVHAHGFAGKRFFPATLVTDDPFVADELSLPTISYQKMSASGDSPATSETDYAIDFSKRITDNFGIGLGTTYTVLHPDGGDTVKGFDNLEAQLKYKFFQSDEHEAILSVGVDFEIGNTGAKRIADTLSTGTPTLFFGKGMGDLPEDWKWLRPFAVTGTLGVTIPWYSSSATADDSGQITVTQNPNFLEWGFAFEYSLPYLQSFVQDVGLRAPFDRMIPVVELPLTTGLNRGASGTTGTVNPGVLWAGKFVQLSIEAQIPINRASGSHTGVIGQLHFYLDDLFPTTFGKPLFGS